MTNYLNQIENALIPLAENYVPEGSSSKAVVDQWLHALANGSDLFASNRGISRTVVLETLKGVLPDVELTNLKEIVYSHLALKPDASTKFRFIDLFAGIGGMRLGFQNNSGLCVFSSEFEKNAQATYSANHGEFPFGDITKIDAADIPDHDVLVAGFPCQAFSHAGLKLGIDDTRGTLFHDIARILEAKKPKFALLENVKGLISHDKGYTLQVILKTLTRIGYSCNIPKEVIHHGTAKQIQTEAKKMVLTSTDFGVPQNRQRIYIVLWQDGLIDSFEYPKPTGEKVKVGDILEANPDPKLTISDRLWDGHQRRKIENKNNGKGFGFGLVTEDSPYTNTISARYYKDGSEILIAQKGLNPRKLSTREAARLQGFPDSFKPSQSNTQAYKQFGNSVTVHVIKELAKQIAKNLN